jgi:hypothetical protein
MNTEIRELNVAELDLVSGGSDPNYKECVLGTKAGGGPGVYPNHVECKETSFWAGVAQAVVKGAQKPQ